MTYPIAYSCHHSEHAYDCCDSYHGGHHGFAYLVPWCGVCARPVAWCCCKKDETPVEPPKPSEKKEVFIDHEILLAGTAEVKQEKAWLGGVAGIHVSVEYMPNTEAEEYEVTVTVQWPKDSKQLFSFKGPLAEGYYSETKLEPVKPGMSITLSTRNAIARLRWIETLNA